MAPVLVAGCHKETSWVRHGHTSSCGYEDVLHAVAWGGLSWLWPPSSRILCPLAADSWPSVLARATRISWGFFIPSLVLLHRSSLLSPRSSGGLAGLSSPCPHATSHPAQHWLRTAFSWGQQTRVRCFIRDINL